MERASARRETGPARASSGEFHLPLPIAVTLVFCLVTALLAFDLIRNVLNVARGLVPAVTLFSSLIYAFGAFCVALFFFVFHKAQS